jgi:hypothetical protein
VPKGKVQMIEADLVKHPACPRNGFSGNRLWQNVVASDVDGHAGCGPILNPEEWRDLTE